MTKETITLFDFMLHLQGGGQRVCVNMAEALSDHYDVSLHTKDIDPKRGTRWLEYKFGVDISNVRITSKLEPCDIFLNAEYAYWAIDPAPGHIKLIMAHDAHVLGMTPDYLSKYDALLVNSEFSSTVFKRQEWPFEPIVMYPPIYRPQNIDWEEKENLVLTVGRFDHRRDKNSFPATINCIRAACNQGLSGYRFVFAGWIVDNWVLDELRQMAVGYPIDFYANQSEYQLAMLYRKAKYLLNIRGITSSMPPRFTSHEALGLVTVEGIAHGAIPIVHDFGGHQETVPFDDLRASDRNGVIELIKKLPGGWSEETRRKRWQDVNAKAEENFGFESFKNRFVAAVKEVRQ